MYAVGCSFSYGSTGWEMDTLTKIFSLVCFVKIRWEVEDSIWWRPTQSQIFEAKSFYKVLHAGVEVVFFSMEKHLEGESSY